MLDACTQHYVLLAALLTVNWLTLTWLSVYDGALTIV